MNDTYQVWNREKVALGWWLALLLVACSGGSSTPGADPADQLSPATAPCVGTVRGGTFAAADGTATLTLAEGALPRCANVTTPPTIEPLANLPADFPRSWTDLVVTGVPPGYRIDLNAEQGFSTVAPGAVTLRLPYDATEVAEADRRSGVKLFVRAYDPETGVAADLHGRPDGVGTVTVTTQGLPAQAVVAVLYRSTRRAVTWTPTAPAVLALSLPEVTDRPPWPASAWCAIYDSDSSELQQAVQAVSGTGMTPSESDLAATIQNRLIGAARTAQQAFEQGGFRAPFLALSADPDEPCGDVLGAAPRFTLHVIDTRGSHYTIDDPEEISSPYSVHYGRIYIRASRLATPAGDPLGTVLASVAHEMMHAVQRGHGAISLSSDGVDEGLATTWGSTLDQGAISVRSPQGGETFLLGTVLFSAVAGESYTNQDFVAWVSRQYGGGGHAWAAGLLDALHDGVEVEASKVDDPAYADALRWRPGLVTLWRAADGYLRATFGSGLIDAHREFVVQRALAHAEPSRFGRTGETTFGLARELFPPSADGSWAPLQERTVSFDACSIDGPPIRFDAICPFSARAFRFVAAQPSATGGQDLTLRVVASDGEVGTTSSLAGWIERGGALQPLAPVVTIAGFGATADDEVSVVVSRGAFTTLCDGTLAVDASLACSPSTGSPDTTGPADLLDDAGGDGPYGCGSTGIPACNYVPATGYWNRMCEEYTGSHWASDWSSLMTSCSFTQNATWCASGCPRVDVLGLCRATMGDQADVVYVYYQGVTYGSDVQQDCLSNGGTWE